MIEVTVSIVNPIVKTCTNPDGTLVEDRTTHKVKIEFVLPKRPFFFWVKWELAEQVKFPRGFGVAWVNLATRQFLMCPMPWNIPVGFAIWSYRWFRIGFANWTMKYRAKLHRRNSR